MTKAGTLRLLGALMLLSGCGSGTDTVAMPPGGGSEEAAADTAERAEETGGDSPFDLSVLGPAWDNPATAWEPSDNTPSDCPQFDQLISDFRSWARTQRQHRVDGLLILEFTARAPSAADAAGYLERESTFMGDCATVVYDSGNLFQIDPASSRQPDDLHAAPRRFRRAAGDSHGQGRVDHRGDRARLRVGAAGARRRRYPHLVEQSLR